MGNFVDFKIDTKAWGDFKKSAVGLPAQAIQNAWNRAFNKALKQLLERVKSNLRMEAKDPSGRLEGALRVKRVKKFEPIFWKGGVAVMKPTDRKDERGAYYWHMIEYGHRVVNRAGKFTGVNVKGLGFTLKAFESEQNKIANELIKTAQAEIEKEWKKLSRKR